MRGFYAVTVAAIFVVFSQQTAHSHHHSKELPTCPEDEHGEIILYPKPENCSEFYQCAGGHLFTHHCGPDLYYCAAKEYCDYLYNCDYSNCQMPDAKAKADLPVCEPPSGEPTDVTYYPNAENCSNYYECDNGFLHNLDCPADLQFCSEKSACTWSWDKECAFADCVVQSAKFDTYEVNLEEELPKCPIPTDGNVTLLPNPANCSSFYECDNMVPILTSCPPDLYFCSEQDTCSWLWDTACSHSDCKILGKNVDEAEEHSLGRADLPVCAPPGQSPDATYYPNPENCSLYYECSNGNLLSLSCSGDLLYCSEKQVCSWDWDKECAFSDCVKTLSEVVDVKEHSLGIADLPVCAPPGQSPDATYYPNPENCSLYYECSNGNLLSLSCSGDLLYCSEKEVCSWDWDKECAFSDCVKTLSEVVDVKAPADITCPPIGEGEVILYPNPDNCSTFYECDNMGPVLLQCPGDLLYCSELKNCAWSWDKNCSFSDCKITTNPAAKIEIQPAVTCPVPEDGNVTFVNNPNNCSAYYECDNMVPIPMECPEQTYFCTEKSTCSWIWDPECAFTDCKIVGRIEKKVKADVVCPVPEDGNVTFVNNPNNCSAYYECDNMVPIPMECPEQTYFCTEKSTCSWIWDSECAFTDCKILGRKPVNDDQETFGVPICPPPSGNHNVSYFPNSENCSNYYECDNGRLHILDCPAGLVFCSEKNACTWSWDKECAFDDCTITTESHASSHRIKLPHKKPHKLSIKHQKHNI